jgi:peptide/nickel transport system substrate-binding protein
MKQGFIAIVLVLSVFCSVFAMQYHEAPTLQELVKKGEIPPVEQRLPPNPQVVVPLQEVGKYGGTWREADLYKGGETIFMAQSTEPLVRWNLEGNAVIPNLAEKWDISDDGKIFTFYLKEGVKWSDGYPFTTEDITFWYNYILKDSRLTKSIPGWLKTLVDVKALDEYVIQFEFSNAYPLFLENIAFQSGGKMIDNIVHPKHFLKDYLPAFTPEEELTKRAKEKGYQSWYEYFDFVRNNNLNVNLPSIHAWYLTKVTETEQLLVRNPYYWKVDTEGNQLPYIDYVINEIVLNSETLTMKTAAGEFTFQPLRISLSDFTLFKENEKKGNYSVLLWDTLLGSNFALMPNLNNSDPVKQKLFNTKDFRVALSYAIDREEINEVCYLGLAIPRQATVLPDCPYYEEDLEMMYAEYDPQTANELLDKIGLDKRNAEGYRLRPDGKVLEITIITTANTLYGPWPDVADLVSRYWRAVGIKTEYDALSGTLYSTRRKTTEYDVMTWAYGRGLHPLLEPVFMFPYLQTTGAPLYALWYTSGGKQGEEPPAEIKEVMNLYDEFLVTVNDAKRLEIGKKIVRKSVENLWMIGTVGISPTPLVKKNTMMNVPEHSVVDFILQQIAHTRAEQYFFK